MTNFYKQRAGDQPNLDASLGLIYRLNILWNKVDYAAMSGNFHKWNFWLDRIFCNLLYKEDLEVTQDANGNITNVSLNSRDQKVWNYLNKKVTHLFHKKARAKSKKEFDIIMNDLYQALILKDVGLRKFMQQLRLYLRQSESNPSKAMWNN